MRTYLNGYMCSLENNTLIFNRKEMSLYPGNLIKIDDKEYIIDKISQSKQVKALSIAELTQVYPKYL